MLLFTYSLLMYGYSVSGAETVDSWFANRTGRPVPDGFTKSAIPSLLFGSLISATDPGEFFFQTVVMQMKCVLFL